jgi:hypothetical protein
MAADESVVENQIFIGVPWKDVRKKFETAIGELQEQYPVQCVIFGRNTGQDADDLWQSIQKEIRASAATIFDVTGSNPNVALEFGYAEALGKRRVLTRYDRKPPKSQPGTPVQRPEPSSIMSDLAGKIRVPYKNVTSLKKALQKEFERNPFVVRFENLAKSEQWGKRDRKVAVGIIHKLGGGKQMKKPDLILAVQTDFPAMTSVDVPGLVTELRGAKLLATKRGPKGGVRLRSLKV